MLAATVLGRRNQTFFLLLLLQPLIKSDFVKIFEGAQGVKSSSTQ